MGRFSTALVAATMTSGIALLGGAANAADIYGGGVSLKDAPILPPPCVWCGFYIGGHLGMAFTDNDDAKFRKGDDHGKKYPDNEDMYYGDDGYMFRKDHFLFDDDDDENFIGGVHLGYNWQKFGSGIVFGVEGDIDFADEIDFLASIRGRIGLASERALIYLTGGVAFIDGDNGFGVNFNDKHKDWNGYDWKDEFKFDRKNGDDNVETGWVIGGGVEWMAWGNVSFGIEGLYYNFDLDGGRHDFHVKSYDEKFDHVARFDKDDEFDFWQIRARLTYHMKPRYEPLPPLK